jgi:hypothetical protein
MIFGKDRGPKTVEAPSDATPQIFRHNHTAVTTVQMASTMSMRTPHMPRPKSASKPSRCCMVLLRSSRPSWRPLTSKLTTE